MSSRYRFPVLLCAALQWSCSTPGTPNPSSNPVAASSPAPVSLEGQPSLLECVREGKVGLTSQDRDAVQARFKAYADYAKHGYEDCVSDLRENPFCSLLSVDPNRLLGSAPNKGRREQTRRVAQYLKTADIENLRKADGDSVRAALRMAQLGKKMERLSERLLAEHGGCDLVTVNLLVGAHAEEFSPEPEYLKTALAHYERAAECGEGLDSEKAQYRMGLIQLWTGKKDLADQSFQKVIARQHGEFKARSLFWLQQIHQESGDIAGAQKYRATLKAEFPFSLHNLIAQEKYEGARPAESLQADSVIQYRSKLHPELDPSVGAVEFLLKEGRNDLATQVLKSVARHLEGTEPGFQLYVAVLFDRANDYLGKFRLLSGLFRDAPQVISKPALELYYPKKSLVSTANLKLDEFLVLSLIRQESAFNQRAKSAAGAIGLMQVMPSTARLIDRKTKRAQLYQVDNNVRIGSEYFSRLLKKFDGDAELALAAYNAGSKHVENWLRRYPIENRILFLDMIPFKETREYVAAITRNYYWYTRLYQKAVAENGSQSSQAHHFKILN